MLSPVQLHTAPRFTELVFEKNPNYAPSEVGFNYEFEQLASISDDPEQEGLHRIEFRISCTKSKETPIHIAVAVHGVFELLDEFPEGASDDDKRKAVVVSGCSVLLGHLRQKVIDITLQMPFVSPIIIPLYNPNAFQIGDSAEQN